MAKVAADRVSQQLHRADADVLLTSLDFGDVGLLHTAASAT